MELRSEFRWRDLSFVQKFLKQFQEGGFFLFFYLAFGEYAQPLPRILIHPNKYHGSHIWLSGLIAWKADACSSAKQNVNLFQQLLFWKCSCESWNASALQRHQRVGAAWRFIFQLKSLRRSSSSEHHSLFSTPASAQCILGEQQFGRQFLWHLPNKGLLLYYFLCHRHFSSSSLQSVYKLKSGVYTSVTLWINTTLQWYNNPNPNPKQPNMVIYAVTRASYDIVEVALLNEGVTF